MLHIRVLGCGASLGVPVIGCDCRVCKSSSPYNKRLRAAIFIDNGATKVLVDFGFEIKQQLLAAQVNKLDAAILTHDHADHVSGIDNLRIFPLLSKRPLDIFTDQRTVNIIQNRYEYLFSNKQCFIAKPVDFFAKITINDLNVQFFKQHHGLIDSLGIRIANFAYSSDVSDFPENSRQYLKDLEVWILDCASYQSTEHHAGLDKVLKWNQEYQPRQILLTNMRHDIDYSEISKQLPSNIYPLYDGYQFTL